MQVVQTLRESVFAVRNPCVTSEPLASKTTRKRKPAAPSPGRSRVFEWFAKRFGEPTPAQAQSWPLITQGRNLLLASPTGTGKTFAAFLGVLDALVQAHDRGELR